MKTFLILVFYSTALFLMSFFLLDFESMMLKELAKQKEFEIPENVLLDMLEDMQYWNKFSILLTFLILSLKCFLMALILYAGLFFANRHQGIKLGSLFMIAVYAESIIVLGGMLKVFLGTLSDLTYSEFSLFAPLSVLSLLDITSVKPIWYYPLQLLNLFEVIYCLLLIYFFSNELDFKRSESSKLVMSTYAFSMSFWMVLILFLTLNFT
ncbi:hypothetical protein [Mongoliitalea daihaiensis]|uniref:hypothetical protein n=1 Tax=Mongoliitalea daihaiensis TaxID=2782006 RepID=UPI001F3DA99F|nr:hypothetical protein [Mongoliitalea daihaiensis]UJP66776.1 hypothetical protein IPZ59_09395 [Mongoliitalea daihaiensis]